MLFEPPVLPAGDIFSDSFGYTFHRFGGHLQTGQEFDLLAAMLERPFLPHHGVHAAYAGREVRIHNVQFGVDGKPAFVAVRAQIPGAGQFRLSQGGQDVPRAQFAVMGLLATGARDGTLFGRGLGELQPLTQRRGSRPMKGSAEGHFDRLQIGSASVFPLGKDTAQQCGYFARDLGLDRLGRFFSSGVSVSSTGRRAQICSLISMSSPQSC